MIPATQRIKGPLKPAGIPRIDWTHPLARNLIFYAYDVGGNYIDLVSGARGTLNVSTNRSARATSQYGTGLKFPVAQSASDWITFPLLPRVAAVQNTAPYSWGAGLMCTASGTTGSWAVNTTDGTNNSLLIGNGTSSATTFQLATANAAGFLTAANTFSLNAYHTALGVATSSTTLNLYVDGKLDSSPTGTTTTFTSSTLQPVINSILIASSSVSGASNFVYFYAIWQARALSAADARLLHNDPYCFLIFPEDDVFALLKGTAAVVGGPVGATSLPTVQTAPARRQDYIQDTNQALYQTVPMPVVTAFTYDMRWRTLPRQDYIQDTNQALYQIVPVVGQYDWPNPRWIARRDYGWTDFLSFLAPGIVPPPFAQTDWPNPRAPQWPVSLYTALGGRLSTAVGPQQPFAQIDWPNPQRRPALSQDWIADTNQALLFPAQLVPPLVWQYDWPNPQRRPGLLQDWIADTNQALLFPAQLVMPLGGQTDWPNPQRRPGLLQDWIAQTNQALLLPPYVPYPSYSGLAPQALPIWPRWPISLYTFLGGRLSAPVGPQPFAQTDWPNPRAPQYSIALYTWTSGVAPAPVVVVSAPFVQTDWPNPRAAFDVRQYQSFIDHISIELIPPEGNQKNWPNPRGPQYSIALYTWVNGLAPPPVVVVPAPFVPTDWPVPRGARWPISLYTWLGGRGSAAPIIVNPFAQTDWPNPQAPRRSIDLYGWICALSSLNLPAPPTPVVAQYDWPNPRAAQRSIDLYGWICALSALNLPAPIAPPPTNYDWPNPRATQRGITLGTSNPNRVYVPPIVPPPVVTPQGGGAGFVHFFSHRRWREFMAAYDAEVRAIMDRRGSRPVAQQEAIEAAITATNRAILHAREAAETAKLNADLVRLANALDAAVGAKKVAYSIKRANAAIAASEAIIAEARRQAEEDEEDMAAILLMLH
jgi:hypothetical protein